MLDFSRSAFHWLTHEGSSGRFSLESVLKVIDKGKESNYALLSGAMAGNMYAEKALIKEPPYFYQAIFGQNENRIMRTFFPDMRTNDSSSPNSGLFSKTQLILGESTMQEMKNEGEISKCMSGSFRFTGFAEISSGDERKIQLFFPVKHLNFQNSSGAFHVETGPVLFVDGEEDDFFRTLQCGYIAFNIFDKFEYLYYDRKTLREFRGVRKADIKLFVKHDSE